MADGEVSVIDILGGQYAPAESLLLHVPIFQHHLESGPAIHLLPDRFRAQVGHPGRRPEVPRDGRKRPRHEQSNDAQDDQYLGALPNMVDFALGTTLDRLSALELAISSMVGTVSDLPQAQWTVWPACRGSTAILAPHEQGNKYPAFTRLIPAGVMDSVYTLGGRLTSWAAKAGDTKEGERLSCLAKIGQFSPKKARFRGRNHALARARDWTLGREQLQWIVSRMLAGRGMLLREHRRTMGFWDVRGLVSAADLCQPFEPWQCCRRPYLLPNCGRPPQGEKWVVEFRGFSCPLVA